MHDVLLFLVLWIKSAQFQILQRLKVHVFECTLSTYPGHVGEDMWSGYEARVHAHVSNSLLAVLQVMDNWLSSWKNGQV